MLSSMTSKPLRQCLCRGMVLSKERCLTAYDPLNRAAYALKGAWLT